MLTDEEMRFRLILRTLWINHVGNEVFKKNRNNHEMAANRVSIKISGTH